MGHAGGCDDDGLTDRREGGISGSTFISGFTFGTCAALFTMAITTQAHAGPPSCTTRSKALVEACADSTTSASIDALGLAQRIAEESLIRQGRGIAEIRSTEAAWLRSMSACAGQRRCLMAEITIRQQQVNAIRLERPMRSHAQVDPSRGEPPPVEQHSPPASVVTQIPPYLDGRPQEAVQPPAAARAPEMHMYPQPAMAMPALTSHSVNGDEGGVAYGQMSAFGWMLSGVAAAFLVPIGARVVMTRVRPMLKGRRTCPQCGEDALEVETVAVERPSYSRRRGQYREDDTIRSERVRHVCQCGYTSDGQPPKPAQPMFALTDPDRIGGMGMGLSLTWRPATSDGMPQISPGDTVTTRIPAPALPPPRDDLCRPFILKTHCFGTSPDV